MAEHGIPSVTDHKVEAPSDHAVLDSVSGCMVPQIRDQRRQQCRQRGLQAGLVLREQADDKGNGVPCDRLRRLLMTTDTVGGVWDYSLELAAGLARSGASIILATMGPPAGPGQRAQAAAIPGLTLVEGNYRLEWMPDSDLDVARAGKWLLGLEKRFAPDLVHLNGYAHAVLPWRAPCLVVAHSCVLSWWRAVKGEAEPREWQPYAKRVAAGLQAADAVVAPTGAMLDILQEIYGGLSCTKTIWNGRHPERYGPAVKEDFVFGAGRLWDEAKDLAALQELAPALSWPVLLAGSWQRPEGGGRPPAGAHCLGLLSADEMAGWLSRAAVYALPARYEPFGLSVLEAALSGCALVLGDIPTLRELWQGAALFVPPGDRERLRAELAKVIAAPELRVHLGLAARERARRYSSGRMTAAYLELYGELCSRSAAEMTTSAS
jgi:glycogen synthase